MARRGLAGFTTIVTEGGLLPSDLLQRLLARDRTLEGLAASDYHLADQPLNEAITESWHKLTRVWAAFQRRLAALPSGDPATTDTRERWLLPLFQELGYGRLVAARPVELGGRAFPVSHWWQRLPIHLVGWGVELDQKTTGVAGAARTSPHALIQELLNRSRDHVWGVVSNGRRLRLLRDNASLTRQAYVEFDLEGMFGGEVFPDFAVLWLLLHVSRVEAERPGDWWLERWAQAAQRQGIQVRDRLRDQVERAIETLGSGFLAHPANGPLRDALRSGRLTGLDYYRQLLRVIYRLLFLFIAEDRELLHPPGTPENARETYRRYYSAARLRELAGGTFRGTPHGDLWEGLKLVMTRLGHDAGCPPLGLPPLGSFLWSPDAVPDLGTAALANRDLLDAVRHLAWTESDHVRRPVDYRNLGPEELGSVYEALLELHPSITVEPARLTLTTASGHERKTSGSYYTPEPLVQALLDSALDPVLDAATKAPDPESAVLSLKVVDPACGSGHFLIAAAHRIARRLAALRAGGDEPSPAEVRRVLRDVIGRSIYGVDLNPMAVELCKVALWIEALEPGKPLSFLDHRIISGNSLLGTTPALLAGGIPDDAFRPLEGDDGKIAAGFRRQNRKEREGQMALPLVAEPGTPYAELGTAFEHLAATAEDTMAALHAKEIQYRDLVASWAYRHAKLVADAWCAAFVWPKAKGAPEPVTEDLLSRLRANPATVPQATVREIERLAAQYRFLHWHLAFPDVFRLPKSGVAPENAQAGWSGGFDVVLGNPPWERLKLQEKEWFAARRPDIAEAPNAAARRKKIAALAEEDPALWNAWRDALREAEGESHFVRTSGRYPLCGRGDINTYSIFAETMRLILSPTGRVGCIVPTGIATDDTTKFFFGELVASQSLVRLWGFENEELIFPAVHHATKFCLLTLAGPHRAQEVADFVFFARQVGDLADEWRHFSLTREHIALLNPNTHTCPIFRSKRDAEVTMAIYRRVPVLIKEGEPEESSWGIRFLAMFHMANDSGLFQSAGQLERHGCRLDGAVFRKESDVHLPLYEAKMVHHFDHRFGTYEGQTAAQANQGKLPELTEAQHADPCLPAIPRYWVAEDEVLLRAARIPEGLAEAYRMKRAEAVAQLLACWIAGYHLNRGNTDIGAHLIHNRFGSVFNGVTTAVLNQWLTDRRACELEREYPLSDEDLRVLCDSPDPISAARRLIDARCPRWFLGWRDICRATDERTVIASVIPRVAVGHKFLLMLASTSAAATALLLANLNSFVLDYCARQKLGGTSLTYFTMKQFPILPPQSYADPAAWDSTRGAVSIGQWLLPRVLELTYTAWDLTPFARDCGYAGPPFRWENDRRFLLRCEIDAAFFHLYGVSRDDVAYIMDTFPVVRRRDEQQYGDYHTKQVILEIYDRMQESIRTGRPYETRLDPPPADPRCCHPGRRAEP